MSKYHRKPIVFNGECKHPVCGEEVWSKDCRRVFCDKHRHWDGRVNEKRFRAGGYIGLESDLDGVEGNF